MQGHKIGQSRRLLSFARNALVGKIEHALAEQEQREREKDREYWMPLNAEVESLRHNR